VGCLDVVKGRYRKISRGEGELQISAEEGLFEERDEEEAKDQTAA